MSLFKKVMKSVLSKVALAAVVVAGKKIVGKAVDEMLEKKHKSEEHALNEVPTPALLPAPESTAPAPKPRKPRASKPKADTAAKPASAAKAAKVADDGVVKVRKPRTPRKPKVDTPAKVEAEKTQTPTTE
jgi:pyrimidine deaminase RibD-like protein